MSAAHGDPASPQYDIAIVALPLGDRKRFDDEMAKPMNVSNRGVRFSRRVEFYMRGLAAQVSGRQEDAIAAFRDSTRQSSAAWVIPTFEDGLANAFIHYGRWAEAEAELQRLLTLNPDAAPYLYRLAQIADRTGRRSEARQRYEKVVALWPNADPDVPELVRARAWLKNAGASTVATER